MRQVLLSEILLKIMWNFLKNWMKVKSSQKLSEIFLTIERSSFKKLTCEFLYVISPPLPGSPKYFLLTHVQTHCWTIYWKYYEPPLHTTQHDQISIISCQKDVCAKIRFFRRAVQSFLTALQCVIITSLWSYLKLQSAAQHEKHAVFDGTIHFPKFSFILVLQFIRPLGICVPSFLSITTYEQSILRLICHFYLILVQTHNYTSRYNLFVPFFSYLVTQLIRISHLNTF